jgi:polysaccharide pyruvyl transferase WcaK-like protein
MELGLSIALVPMQKSRDLETCRRLHAILNADSFIIDEDLYPAARIALFERFSLVIAMRLHALVFAAIAGVPMLGIGYDPKINAFLAQMEMPLSSDIKSVSSTELSELGLRLWKDRVGIREMLLEKTKVLRCEAFDFADMVIDSLMEDK